MAGKENHIAQWKHNRKLLELIPPEYSDWLATVAFYAALQAVDALLAHDGVTWVDSHRDRHAALSQRRRYHHISLHYKPLYESSLKARYLADPSHWIASTRIDRDVLSSHLYPIEKSVQHLLSRDLHLPKIRLLPPTPPPPPEP